MSGYALTAWRSCSSHRLDSTTTLSAWKSATGTTCMAIRGRRSGTGCEGRFEVGKELRSEERRHYDLASVTSYVLRVGRVGVADHCRRPPGAGWHSLTELVPCGAGDHSHDCRLSDPLRSARRQAVRRAGWWRRTVRPAEGDN